MLPVVKTTLARRILSSRQSLPRAAHLATLPATRQAAITPRHGFPLLQQQRRYKSKKSTTQTDTLVPGSKQPLTDEASLQEYMRTSERVAAALSWFRRECAGYEARASGRVSPALLDSVRVPKGGKGKQAGELVKLEEVATVGVKEGTTLLVTAFDEGNLKAIEAAIYDAKLPGITPQRIDARTIKIPIPKMTVDGRTALYTAAQRQAEETRQQIRKHHQAAAKKGKWEKHSIEVTEFQKLTDKHISEIDAVLASLKKATSGGR